MASVEQAKEQSTGVIECTTYWCLRASHLIRCDCDKESHWSSTESCSLCGKPAKKIGHGINCMICSSVIYTEPKIDSESGSKEYECPVCRTTFSSLTMGMGIIENNVYDFVGIDFTIKPLDGQKSASVIPDYMREREDNYKIVKQKIADMERRVQEPSEMPDKCELGEAD
jgi:hypothetical protein